MTYVPPTLHDRSAMLEAARLRDIARATARKACAGLGCAWDARDRGEAITDAEIETARLRVCTANDAMHEAERAWVRAWIAAGRPLEAGR